MKQADLRELAIKKVRITGDVIGKFGSFILEQTYFNNTKDVLEVGYTFPIVETATVVGFEIHVGDKVLKGVCKEKQEAKEEYTRNLVKGNSSYLMEQETDNVFRISVGKIDKNEEVTVIIKYIDKFEIVDNTINILMPTLVPPRYKSEITDKLTYAKVDYTIDFEINIDKKLKRKRISCPTHEINLIDEEKYEKVTVQNYDMSKDFKLEIELKNELQSSAITSKTKDGKDAIYISFMPEIKEDFSQIKKEFVFVVDTSGSMMGDKMNQTKKAVIECLKQLKEGDKFNIVDFDSHFRVMNLMSLKYNKKNFEKAEKYVNEMKASGGTEILEPVKFALDGDSHNKIVLLFTDGQVGNENQILEYITNNIGLGRLFAFGIDTNVNSSFIKGMAKKGNGKAELILPSQKLEESILRQFKRIQMPMVEDIKIDYGASHLDDEIKEDTALFNYEFFNVLAVVDELKDDIVLKGKIDEKDYSWKIFKEDITKSKVDLELLYAKEQILRLDEYILNTIDKDTQEQYKKMIVELATKNNINSKYTSFITVYERDEKIHDVPKHQETTLSNGFLKGALNGLLSGIKMSTSYVDSGPIDGGGIVCDMDEAQSRMAFSGGLKARMAPKGAGLRNRVVENIENENKDKEKLKKMIKDYYSVFETQKEKSVKTYMLYALTINKLTEQKIEEVLELINNNYDDIVEDSFMQFLLMSFIQKAILVLSLEKIKTILGDNYNDKLVKDIKIVVFEEKLTQEEIHNIVKKDSLDENNIDKALWTVFDEYNLDDTMIEEL